MISALNRLKDKTLELTITIPWEDAKKTYDKVLEETVKSAEIKGFRKGKAPKNIVEESLDKNKLYNLVLEELLPKFYSDSVKEQGINPIINPKVSIVSLEENKDWVFKAQTAEKPEFRLGDYKKEIQGNRAKDKIWLPGQKPDEKKEPSKQDKLNQAIEVLLRTTKLELPAILIEEETARLLSATLEEIKKLGLTLDQYLASTNKTVEALREEHGIRAINSMKLEFILEKIADEEKITVEDTEVDKAINENPDKNIQESLKKNRYLLTSIIKRQKTLEFLNSL